MFLADNSSKVTLHSGSLQATFDQLSNAAAAADDNNNNSTDFVCMCIVDLTIL